MRLCRAPGRAQWHCTARMTYALRSVASPSSPFARLRQAFSLRANFRSLWNPPGTRYAPIDGLRALAMLWVVLTHLCLVISRFVPYEPYVQMMDRNAWLFSWALHGEKALDTFFVISGFLIGTMLLNEHARTGRINLGRFYARRYLRLMPAYAVALAVLLVSGVEGHEKASYAWANLLYVNNFLPQRHMFMDPSWSLAVEEQFYLCLPLYFLFVFFRSKNKLRSLAWLFAASFAISALVLVLHPNITRVPYGDHFIVCAPHFSSEHFDALYVNLYTRFGPFVLGVGLAWAFVHHEASLRALLDAHPRWRDFLVVGGVALLFAVIAVPAFNPHVAIARPALWTYVWLHRPVWALGILFLMIAVLAPGKGLSDWCARMLGARIWYSIAQVSYCSYLFHLGCVLPALVVATLLLEPGLPFTDALQHLGPAELALSYMLTAGFVFFVGTVVYLFVERPFLNLRPR